MTGLVDEFRPALVTMVAGGRWGLHCNLVMDLPSGWLVSYWSIHGQRFRAVYDRARYAVQSMPLGVCHCVVVGCPAWFDRVAVFSGKASEPGWMQTRGHLGGVVVCPEHAVVLPEHRVVELSKAGHVKCLCSAVMIPKEDPPRRGGCEAVYGRHLAEVTTTGRGG